jgi:two-component system, chemotaxis family, protein-glutamate methylesterase/glutaminase
MSAERKIRVLIVDDSAIVRRVLSDLLASVNDIEVVGTAPDPYVARDKILALSPDVITLDIEMPRMDGLTFLDRIMKHRPMPVIIISSLASGNARTAVEAMKRGAVDVVAKPGGPYSVGDLREDLPIKIRAAAAARLRPPSSAPATAPLPAPPPPAGPVRGLLAIGASTGGTTAIEHVMRALPSRMPPIVITQHIPAGFSRAFAERLNTVCALRVQEAVDGQRLEPGLALVAPGDFHLTVEGPPGARVARVRKGDKVCYQRPAVDILFHSLARSAATETTALLLTGMGADGADGMLALRKAGAYTVAQDEASCVVFGMPREAILRNAACQVASLNEMAGILLRRAQAPSAANEPSALLKPSALPQKVLR